jgi:hypothetical protein
VDNRFGAFESALGSIDFLTRDIRTHLMSAEFLQAGHNDFGQVALAITVADLDRLVQLALTQRARNRRRKLPALLTSSVKRNQAIDHNANRPGRHDEQGDNHHLRRPAHLKPHRAWVETHRRRRRSFLHQHKRPNL